MRRTTHRSKRHRKLYAVRRGNGRFKDIQTYKRAHTSDIKRSSRSERMMRRRQGLPAINRFARK